MSFQSPLSITAAIPEELARRLEEEIVFGQLEPSARLTEEELALRFGVSRSPVREAMRLLERDGLVLREARRGIRVAPLSLKDFDEVYACRIALEGLAAEAAARSADERTKQGFAPLRLELKAARLKQDPKEFFLADVRGSALVYALTDNKTLTRLLRGLEKQALRYRFIAYASNPKMVDLSLDDTLRIYDAILACDAAAAKAMTETLIREIWTAMRGTVSDLFGPA